MHVGSDIVSYSIYNGLLRPSQVALKVLWGLGTGLGVQGLGTRVLERGRRGCLGFASYEPCLHDRATAIIEVEA